MKSSQILIGAATLALGSMLAFGATPVSAPAAASFQQQGRGMQAAPADRAKQQAARLKTSMSLTDDQATKVEAAYVTYYTALAPKDGTPASADDRTKATDALKVALKAAGLTDEQVTTATAPRGRRGGGF